MLKQIWSLLGVK